jgi:hypothetical protein
VQALVREQRLEFPKAISLGRRIQVIGYELRI